MNRIDPVLQIIPNQLTWCDRKSLRRLVGPTLDPKEFARSLRNLSRKGILRRVMVNLPAWEKLSFVEESTIETEEACFQTLKRARKLIHLPTHPTEMIGPTPLLAGIVGCDHSMPIDLWSWLAHFRLANARIAYGGSMGQFEHGQGWRMHLCEPYALIAAADSTLIVVPVRLRIHDIEAIHTVVTRWGGRCVFC